MQADEPHPEVQSVLEMVEAADVLPLHQYGPEGAREVTREMRPDVDGPEVGDVTDRTVPGPENGTEVPIRIYRPRGEGEGPFPTVVFFHGGGYVIGDLDSHDVPCRHLVNESGCVVVAVDYRLAPEHPFPAAVEDAHAALEWVAANPDEVGGDGRLAVMGDSAGGNLAAVVSLMARDRDGPEIDRQVLVYPAVSPREDWPSRENNAEGYYLEESDMEWFGDCYYGSDVHEANPYAFPLVACSHADLPPATVLTAGFDPLRDEGVAYAEALSEAGVPVEHRNYGGMIHGFFTMLAGPVELDRAHEAVADVAGDLRGTFGDGNY
jgi:acetyl esterase